MSKNFSERARSHYPFEVSVVRKNRDYSDIVREVEEVYGPDDMPKTMSEPGDGDGRWTIGLEDDHVFVFFVKTERDAIEFKLRFG